MNFARRKISAGIACLGLLFSCTSTIEESRQATGVKVGEVTDTSAIVWMRVTEKAQRRADGIVRRGRADKTKREELNPADLEGSVPGAPGRVRLRYGMKEDLSGARDTGWHEVDAGTDFTHDFRLSGLRPGTVYYYSAETSNPSGSVIHQPVQGRFKTAPPADEYADVRFTVITGQAYRDVDHADGFTIYESMAKLEPEFIVPTGDTVYYDSDDPLVTTLELARYHWQRMYSYPRHIALHLKVSGYWEKDDHDVYANDCWPTLVREFMGSFTFQDGLRVYAEQVPMGEKPYRTFRWGKGLQVWLVEGRDYRSPNPMEDGPEKSIWGEEQKQWLKDTLLASDVDWKVLVSPTPIVGPDRTSKHDNHSNDAFTYEGNEFRKWVQENLPDNFFIACGDRHWQYHSVHPETGVNEFSCGPASDEHAGGTPGEDRGYHKFHRLEGGFLSVSTKRSGDESLITFRLHAVDGSVVYEFGKSRQVK
ncbi:alkaline phosphatase D family protein [Acidobacteria bacterium AH-259-O06]|nr:alkaline phosphatase D family protein [Acidobacteria bacterium AH-259-O06]